MEIVRKYMYQPPLEIDKLFADLDIGYKKVPMKSHESGRIEKTPGGFLITVNSSEGEQRQRFTAAHELAHYLLHRDMLNNGHLDRLFDDSENPSDPFTPAHEVQANRFAAELLMPELLLKHKHEENISLKDLAKTFNVSKAAMKVRLRSLGLVEE